MACTKCLVGDKTTITFGTSGFTAEMTSIGGPEFTREVISTDTLGSHTCVQKCLSDKVNYGEIPLKWCADPDANPPFLGAPETAVITWPPKVGQSNGATMTALVGQRRWKLRDATPNTVMEDEGDWVIFCDPTPPVFAPGS